MSLIRDVMPNVNRQLCNREAYAQAYSEFIHSKTAVVQELLETAKQIYLNDMRDSSGELSREILPEMMWYYPVRITPLSINGKSSDAEAGYDDCFITFKEFCNAINDKAGSEDPVYTEVLFSSAEYAIKVSDLYEAYKSVGLLDLDGKVIHHTPYTFSLVSQDGEYLVSASKVREIQLSPDFIKSYYDYEIQRDPDSYPKIRFSIPTVLNNMLKSSARIGLIDTGLKCLSLQSMPSLSTFKELFRDDYPTIDVNDLEDFDGVMSIVCNEFVSTDDKLNSLTVLLQQDDSATAESIGVYDDNDLGISFVSSNYTGTPASAMFDVSTLSTSVTSACAVVGKVLATTGDLLKKGLQFLGKGTSHLWKKYVTPAYVSKDFVRSDYTDTDEYIDVPVFISGDDTTGTHVTSNQVIESVVQQMSYQDHVKVDKPSLTHVVSVDPIDPLSIYPVVTNTSPMYNSASGQTTEIDRYSCLEPGIGGEVGIQYFYRNKVATAKTHGLDMKGFYPTSYGVRIRNGVNNRELLYQDNGAVFDAVNCDMYLSYAGRPNYSNYVKYSQVESHPGAQWEILVSKKYVVVRTIIGKHSQLSDLHSPADITSFYTDETIYTLPNNLEIASYSSLIFDESAFDQRLWYRRSFDPTTTEGEDGEDVIKHVFRVSSPNVLWHTGYTVKGRMDINIVDNTNASVRYTLQLRCKINEFDTGSGELFRIENYTPSILFTHNGEAYGTVSAKTVNPFLYYQRIYDESITAMCCMDLRGDWRFDSLDTDGHPIIQFKQTYDRYVLKWDKVYGNYIWKHLNSDYARAINQHQWSAQLGTQSIDRIQVPIRYTNLSYTITTTYRYNTSDIYCVVNQSLIYKRGSSVSGIVQTINTTESSDLHYSDGSLRFTWNGENEFEGYGHYVTPPLSTVDPETLQQVLSSITHPIDDGCATTMRFKMFSLMCMNNSDGLRSVMYLNPIPFSAVCNQDGSFKLMLIDRVNDVYRYDGYSGSFMDCISKMLSNIDTGNNSYDYEEGDILAFQDIYAAKILTDFYLALLQNIQSDSAALFPDGSYNPRFFDLSIHSSNLNANEINNAQFVSLIRDGLLEGSSTIETINTIFLTHLIMNKPSFVRLRYILSGDDRLLNFIPYHVGYRLRLPLWHISTDDDIQNYVDKVCTALVITAIVIAAAVTVGAIAIKAKSIVRRQLLKSERRVYNSKMKVSEDLSIEDKALDDLKEAKLKLQEGIESGLGVDDLADLQASVDLAQDAVKQSKKTVSEALKMSDKLQWKDNVLRKLGSFIGVTPNLADGVSALSSQKNPVTKIYSSVIDQEDQQTTMGNDIKTINTKIDETHTESLELGSSIDDLKKKTANIEDEASTISDMLTDLTEVSSTMVDDDDIKILSADITTIGSGVLSKLDEWREADSGPDFVDVDWD